MKKMTTPVKNNSMYLFFTAAAYLMTFITTSLMNKIVSLSENMTLMLHTMSSILQAPMLLAMMLAFAGQESWGKWVKKLLALVLSGSALAMAVMGLQEQTLLYIMFGGSVPVLLMGSVLFIQVVGGQPSLTSRGDALILTGIIFTAGTSLLLLGLNNLDPVKHANDFRELLGLVTLIAAVPLSVGLFMSYHFSVPVLKPADAFSPIKAGKAQWENFSLSNTPDVIKTSVTDISKYYSEVQ